MALAPCVRWCRGAPGQILGTRLSCYRASGARPSSNSGSSSGSTIGSPEPVSGDGADASLEVLLFAPEGGARQRQARREARRRRPAGSASPLASDSAGDSTRDATPWIWLSSPTPAERAPEGTVAPPSLAPGHVYGLHPAMLPDTLLLAQCARQTTRRSGPGGQHRNKTETAVVLTHPASGLRGEGAARRQQPRNQQTALLALRWQLAVHARSDARWLAFTAANGQLRAAAAELAHPLVGDPASLARRLWHDHPGARNRRFPALLAMVLDVLVVQAALEPAETARVLAAFAEVQVQTEAIEAVLGQAPRALAKVNRARAAVGLEPLQPR